MSSTFFNNIGFNTFINNFGGKYWYYEDDKGISQLIISGNFNGNEKKELTRLPVWGPSYRVSLGVKIKAFSERDSDNEKFLLIKPRHPLVALNKKMIYIQTKLNDTNSSYSFKPNLNQFYNIEVTQYIENNEVRKSISTLDRIIKNIKTTFSDISITTRYLSTEIRNSKRRTPIQKFLKMFQFYRLRRLAKLYLS